jgi:hypothetical protein
METSHATDTELVDSPNERPVLEPIYEWRCVTPIDPKVEDSPLCGALKRSTSAEAPPSCGNLATQMNRFPDGGWQRSEQWTPHHALELVREVSADEQNPMAGLL